MMKKSWIVFSVTLLLLTGLLSGCPNDVNGNGNGDTGFTFTLSQSGGTLNRADSGIINFMFDRSVPRNGIFAEDIEIIAGQGTAVINTANATLSNSPGASRLFEGFTVVEQGTVYIRINRDGFSSVPRQVEVFRKLGLETDNIAYNIANVVRLGGTPTLDSGSQITFARYDGDPIAILPPTTRDPMPVINAANPAVEEVIARFNPPLDLRTTDARQLRWFDLVWDNFGTYWTFPTESTSGGHTSDTWTMHNVQFQLDLGIEGGGFSRFQATSERTTSGVGAAVPLRIIAADNVTTGGSVAWGEGHLVESVTLRVSSIHLRGPGNQNVAWPGINAERAPWFDDLWVSSLTVDMILPPPPIVLYENGVWHPMVQNPRWGHGDAVFTDAAIDVSGGIPPIPALSGRQNRIIWDPIDISVPGTPYHILIVEGTGWTWTGFGSLSLTAAGIEHINMSFEDAGMPARIPLDSDIIYGGTNFFNPEQFIGFFLETNHGPDPGTLNFTRIRLE